MNSHLGPWFALCTAAGVGLLASGSSLAAAPDDWPQWRGPARTGHAAPGARLPASLPKDALPLWKKNIGGGFSSPVVSGGKLVCMDEDGKKEVLRVMDAATGRELWSVAIADRYQDEWGAGPRSTPMVDEGLVYALTCNGELRCFRLADGSLVWGASFEKDFGVRFLGSKAREGTASRRGNNGCGVIDGSRLVVPVGSTEGASLVCFDKATGKVLWKSGTDEAAYSSFMVADLAGRRQVVAFTADALLGADLRTGQILWRVPLTTSAKRHAATPVIFGDCVVVASHSIGMRCFRIAAADGAFKPELAWSNPALKVNLATSVLVDGFLYTLGAGKDFVCVQADSGKIRWTQPGYGRGSKDYAAVVASENRLLVMTESGEMVLVDANPEKCVERGRLQVCGSTWCHPAYAGGRLFIRDGRQLYCFGLQDSPPSP